MFTTGLWYIKLRRINARSQVVQEKAQRANENNNREKESKQRNIHLGSHSGVKKNREWDHTVASETLNQNQNQNPTHQWNNKT